MYIPQLSQPSVSRDMTREFKGYNHNLVIGDGEFYDMTNCTGKYYPALSPRDRRGTYAELTDARGILAKDAMAWIDGSSLYYNGLEISGITLNGELPKQMVSMGAYLLIFPDNIYFNTQDFSDKGYLGNEWENDGASVTLTMCRPDGSAYQNVVESADKPDTEEDGAYWLDISAEPSVLKQYSQTAASWYPVASVCCKIAAANIHAGFSAGDGVTITADKGGGGVFLQNGAAYGGSYVLQEVGEGYIVVIGVMNTSLISYNAGNSIALSVERRIPALDYVTESENRIWGCHYGIVNGEAVNEIYACKLGDAKNWFCYQGIASDSYAVSLGSDGVFTGAATYQGHPVFFKENCIHKVYGDFPSNYSVQTTNCRGVQKGSWRSVQIVNEALIYKSYTDVCVYDGSLPVSISDALGKEHYRNAAAGAVDGRYYISMQADDGAYHMFVYDLTKNVWHREDCTHALAFARMDHELYYIDADTNAIMAANGLLGTQEKAVAWSAVSGCIGYDHPDNKYVARVNLRMLMEEGATLRVSVQYDSYGEWEDQVCMEGVGRTRSVTVPVLTRRCDHFRLRFDGTGVCRLFSIAKIIEYGSDENHD